VQASLAVIGIPTRVLASEDLSAYVMAENDDTGNVTNCQQIVCHSKQYQSCIIHSYFIGLCCDSSTSMHAFIQAD
jgi:hypothetical protein